jgi:anti-anti-sigma regulatory factor
MNITVEQAQGRVPVTIMGLHGELDGSNYLDVIDKAKELYDAGTRDLLIDMSNVTFMASSGVVALHSIALLLQGQEPPDPEYGWSAFHAIERDRDSGVQEHVKILNPHPDVDRTLEMTGLKGRFFEIYTDQGAAIASF